MTKAIKKKGTITKKFHEAQSTKNQIGTFFLFFGIFLIILHVLSCIWYLIADVEDDNDNWVYYKGFSNYTKSNLYLKSLYYITATLCTIGYGDITPISKYEKMFAIIIMLAGIISYSYVVGTLTVFMTTLNNTDARLKEWLQYLNMIKVKYNINHEFYLKLRRSIENEISKGTMDKVNFLQLLPKNLKLDVSYFMYSNYKNIFPFFKYKSKRFIANVCPMLKPQKIRANDYIFLEKDGAEDIYFLKSGVAMMVMPIFRNIGYIKIEEGHYFGELDFLLCEDEFPKRKFSIKAISDCELLLISINTLYKECIGFDNYFDEILKTGEKRLKKVMLAKDIAISNFKNGYDEDDCILNCKSLKEVDNEIYLDKLCDSSFKESEEKSTDKKMESPEINEQLSAEDMLDKIKEELNNIELRLTNAESKLKKKEKTKKESAEVKNNNFFSSDENGTSSQSTIKKHT